MAGGKAESLGRLHAGDAIVAGGYADDGILPDAQSGRGVQGFLHNALVGQAIHLGAGGAHRRPLAHVKHAKLYASRVGPQAHHAAQGVDFAGHVPFCQAADGGIAGKVAQTVKVAAHKQHAVAHAGQGHGGFATCVAASGHDTVKKGGVGIRHVRDS